MITYRLTPAWCPFIAGPTLLQSHTSHRPGPDHCPFTSPNSTLLEKGLVLSTLAQKSFSSPELYPVNFKLRCASVQIACVAAQFSFVHFAVGLLDP